MILTMQNIFKDYMRGKTAVPVLRNISLEVEEGEYLAIMGPSGSGKTTLMNLIGCLDKPTSGTYIFNNRDIMTRTDDQLAVIRNKHIGFVFQNFYLLPNLTALDNVALPLLYADVKKKERQELAREALRRVGLEDRMTTKVGLLSGGQRQAVTLLMASLQQPKLLLLDEHTAALDPATAAKALELSAQTVNENKLTTLMITHNMTDAIKHGNRLVMMNEGRIIFDVEGENKKKLTKQDLMDKFAQISGTQLESDQILLAK